MREYPRSDVFKKAAKSGKNPALNESQLVNAGGLLPAHTLN